MLYSLLEHYTKIGLLIILEKNFRLIDAGGGIWTHEPLRDEVS